jgi:hypothetical protein
MSAYTSITATPLDALAAQLRLLNDRERLLLIDWLADGFDNEELAEPLFDGMVKAMFLVAEELPDNMSLDYPGTGHRADRWIAFRAARDERLNLRLGAAR